MSFRTLGLAPCVTCAARVFKTAGNDPALRRSVPGTLRPADSSAAASLEWRLERDHFRPGDKVAPVVMSHVLVSYTFGPCHGMIARDWNGSCLDVSEPSRVRTMEARVVKGSESLPATVELPSTLESGRVAWR